MLNDLTHLVERVLISFSFLASVSDGCSCSCWKGYTKMWSKLCHRSENDKGNRFLVNEVGRQVGGHGESLKKLNKL